MGESSNFLKWSPVKNAQGGYLHKSISGQWECPDFYKLPNGKGNSTHLLKASTRGTEYWLVGSYDDATVTFTPSSSDMSKDPSYRYDYGAGVFYASKSFYDP